MRPLPLAAAALLVLGLCYTAAAAGYADETYAVSGSDNFSIGSGDVRSKVSYHGVERLRVVRHGALTRYRADVNYTRDDGGARSSATGHYVADVSASGETVASSDRDPDNLTVLNQPFAAVLDRQTLHALEHLSGALPFDFPSPFTNSSLHGYLQHLGDSTLVGRRVIGIRFEAAGPMHGNLPDRPELALVGTIAMRGTAFYDVASTLLLALESTVTVAGNVSNRSAQDPVTIVYARTIRAELPRRPEAQHPPASPRPRLP